MFSTIITSQMSTIATTPSDKVSVENKSKTLQTVIKEAAWKEPEKTWKQLENWIPATTIQPSAIAEKASLCQSLGHRSIQSATARSAKVDPKEYRIGMAEKIQVTLETGEFNRLVWLIRHASNECSKHKVTLYDTTYHLIHEQDKKIERGAEHFDQPSNRRVYRTTNSPSSVGPQAYDISCDPPSIPQIMDVVIRLKTRGAAR